LNLGTGIKKCSFNPSGDFDISFSTQPQHDAWCKVFLKMLALFGAFQETGCIFQKDEEADNSQFSHGDDKDLDDLLLMDTSIGKDKDTNTFYEVLQDSCSLKKSDSQCLGKINFL